MKEEKIYEIKDKVRCIKKGLKYKSHKFEVYIRKDSPAKIIHSKILISEEFLTLHSSKEQLIILFHEKYHSKFSTKIKKLFNVIRFFSFKKANWCEEFSADAYSAKINGNKEALKTLKGFKKFYDSGKVKYNPKTHPPLDERIKRIESLQ